MRLFFQLLTKAKTLRSKTRRDLKEKKNTALLADQIFLVDLPGAQPPKSTLVSLDYYQPVCCY